MADKIYLVVTIRKEVEDRIEARAIFDTVKAKMADKPELTITGHCSNHFEIENG